MSKSITVNTGEKIEVRNTDGELMGFFYFNPAECVRQPDRIISDYLSGRGGDLQGK